MAATEFPDRLSALEQENAMLRRLLGQQGCSQLQQCEQSYAVLQAEVAEYKRREQERYKHTATVREQGQVADLTSYEPTQQALLQAEQVRSQELERINAELQQTLDRLSESEARYRALFELSSEGIYRWELDQPIPLALPVSEQVDRLYRYMYVAEANAVFAGMYRLPSTEAALGLRLSDVHISTSDKNLELMCHYVENGYRIRAAESEEVDNEGKKCYFLNNIIGIVENGQLTGGWGTQLNITELRETQQVLLRVEQDRVAELAKANEELLQREHELQHSYRLLSAVAEVAKDLLENPHIDNAIDNALKKIGETAGISRVGLMQEKPSEENGRMQHRVLAEWTAPGIPRQSEDPRTKIVYTDEYAILADELHNGRSIWHLVTEFPEPARTHQLNISVKSTGAVPIFIEGEYFGCVFFDNCVDYRQWSTHEINVLTFGAGAIGAALHRKQLVDRLVEERIHGEQEQVAELAKANDALKQTVDVLATETDFDLFLGHVLQVIAEQLEAPLTEYWYCSKTDDTARVGLTYWRGQILKPEEQPGHIGLYGYPVPPEMMPEESLHHRCSHFITEDVATSAIHIQIANEFGLDAGAWYRSRGVSRLLNVPLILGEKMIGALIVFLPSHRHFTKQQIELTYTLAQQVTLAIQLTNLAEEAKQVAIFEERNRMASEIHDTLAQVFTGISLQLEVAKPLIHQEPQTVERILEYTSQLAETGLTEARRSVWALYPPAAEYADLAQMLYESVEHMTRNTSIAVEVNVRGNSCPLPPFMGMNLLRIGQEALTNALKHAQAQKISIDLGYEPDRIWLTISDDGRGFTPFTYIDSLNDGFGLVSMYERGDRIGAQVSLISQLGQGTQILVEAPLN
ncbi:MULTISPECIES: sensor histidine kinase [Nostocales]|nr:GAF domain-containing sensor histidine kinase [Tolypothrix bouteillei]